MLWPMVNVSREEPPKVNPWLIIFFASTIAFGLLGFLVYRWTLNRSDASRVALQLMKRQNSVLAHDAMNVAREVAHLLENAARDVQALALVAPTSNNFTRFYLAHISQVSQADPRDDSVGLIPLPIYNELIYLNSQGDEVVRLRNGHVETRLRKLAQCSEADLCDAQLIRDALKLSVGEIYVGRTMRYYTPENAQEQLEGATLPVVYRTTEGVLLTGIDYRYFKEILLEPAFPYERKRNLLQSYQNGNYIYIVDDRNDIIVHPKVWHSTGVDRKTGRRVLPIVNDSDEGTHSLNIEQYRGERLREYFNRLLTKSFVQKAVDIFEATNLKGVSRVLSVAPILLNKAQFRKTGVYGHVIVGCSIEYFEEPREQYVPYY
jgi:hypothetical protein